MNENSHKPKPLLPLLLILLLVALYNVRVSYRAPLESIVARSAPEVQYLWGNCYYARLSTEQGDAQAAKWFQLAAAHQHAKAQTALGIMYRNGTGVKRSYQTALGLFRQAAQHGLDSAENQLGIMYAEGKGVPQDLDAAAGWFSKAANRGNQAAGRNLKFLAATRPTHVASLILRNGTIYRGVNVRKVEPDGVTISYQPSPDGFGITKLQFRDLPRKYRNSSGQLAGLATHFARSAQLTVVEVGAM